MAALGSVNDRTSVINHSEDDAFSAGCLSAADKSARKPSRRPCDYEAFFKKFRQISEISAASATPEAC